MKRYYFFTLHDPRNPEGIRYIGSTTENLNIRLSKMVSEAVHTDKETDVALWIRELFDLDLRPMINLLYVSETISEGEANDKQAQFIEEHQAKGQCDLNMTKGRGTQGHTYEHKEETKKIISEVLTKDVDLERMADLRQQGLSWKKLAAEMDIAYMTAFKRKEEIEAIIAARGGSDEAI